MTWFRYKRFLIIAKIIAIISSIISVVLFLSAPKGHSSVFCYGCFSVFLADVFLLFLGKVRNGLIVYEFIFSVTFFYVNYVYPVFIYPITPYFSLFNLPFPEEYINSGIALSTIAFSFFTLGDLKYEVYNHYHYGINKKTMPCPEFVKIIGCVMLIILVIKLIPIYLSGTYDGNWGDGGFVKAVADILVFYVVFSQFTRCKTVKGIVINNWVFLFLTLSYIVIISMIGNRGMLMRIFLLVSLLYTVYQRKISVFLTIVVMIGGMFLLYYIGTVRGGGTFDGLNGPTRNPLLTVGKDLTINNRSLYSLLEWRNLHGLNFGKTFLMNIFSVIPFGQSLLLNITGWSPFEISSAGVVTDDFFSHYTQYGEMIGLGTNVVGDIYISFGLVGVIIMMFILGRIIGYCYYKAQRGSLLGLLVYSVLFMDSIIITRSSILCSIRNLAWMIMLYCVLLIFEKYLSWQN